MSLFVHLNELRLNKKKLLGISRTHKLHRAGHLHRCHSKIKLKEATKKVLLWLNTKKK